MDGTAVDQLNGNIVGPALGILVGSLEGFNTNGVGLMVGSLLGALEGRVGLVLGCSVGGTDGAVGKLDANRVGLEVG